MYGNHLRASSGNINNLRQSGQTIPPTLGFVTLRQSGIQQQPNTMTSPQTQGLTSISSAPSFINPFPNIPLKQTITLTAPPNPSYTISPSKTQNLRVSQDPDNFILRGQRLQPIPSQTILNPEIYQFQQYITDVSKLQKLVPQQPLQSQPQQQIVQPPPQIFALPPQNLSQLPPQSQKPLSSDNHSQPSIYISPAPQPTPQPTPNTQQQQPVIQQPQHQYVAPQQQYQQPQTFQPQSFNLNPQNTQLPQSPQFNENNVLLQELNKAKNRIEELERQLDYYNPQLELWRDKYSLKQQEEQTIRLKQSVATEDKSETLSKLESELSQREKEVQKLQQVNEQLQSKLKQVSFSTNGDQLRDSNFKSAMQFKEMDIQRLMADKLAREQMFQTVSLENQQLKNRRG